MIRGSATTNYRGRFAPSPTGPLHIGSLVAATASYLDAHSAGGDWHIRIDNIDPPRAVAGATTLILTCLDQHGLYSAVPTVYQSQHHARYDRALEQLSALGLLFSCSCTRATLGHQGCCIRDCRQTSPGAQAGHSWRIQVPEHTETRFDDLFLGEQHEALAENTPNFIVKRRDGLYAYQLAAAVDDGGIEVNHVVRGADLLSSTHRQVFLQQQLTLTSPQYGHVPILTDNEGNKLSKQTGASAVDPDVAGQNLRQVLAFLGQQEPPAHLLQPAEILDFASDHWDRDCVTR